MVSEVSGLSEKGLSKFIDILKSVDISIKNIKINNKFRDVNNQLRLFFRIYDVDNYEKTNKHLKKIVSRIKDVI